MSTALPLLRKYQLYKVGSRLKSQEFSGTLVLQEPDGRTVVTFSAGNAIKAASTQVSLSFPAFLLRKRRIERLELKKLLEESSRKGVKLEELLVSNGMFTRKDLLRLQRELSIFVFASSFRKEKIPYRLAPSEQAVEERNRLYQFLELHEGLFRAVSADKDIKFMERMFKDRWQSSLAKTADFYRYLIQFRSVFYGEDITDLLMQPETTPQDVLDAASDREAAVRQLFALCYSGMLTIDAEAEEHEDGFEESAGAADQSKTVVIVSDSEMDESSIVTSIIATDGGPFAGEDAETSAPLSEVERFLEHGFTEVGEDDEFMGGPIPHFSQTAPRDPDDGQAGTSTLPLGGLPAEPLAQQTLPLEDLSEVEIEAQQTLVLGSAGTGTPDHAQATAKDAPLDQVEAGETLLLSEKTENDYGGIEAAETMAIGSAPAFVGDDQESDIMIGDGVQEELPGAVAGATQMMVHSEMPSDAPGEKHRTVEDLLKRAVEEAEKVVAAREAAGEQDDALPAPEPILEEEPDPPEPPEELFAEPEKPLLATMDPEPIPERPDAVEPGTDESIERILEDVYRSMLSRNLYQVLNVTPFAPLSAIRDGATRFQAKYAPDQYRGYMLSSRAKQLLASVGNEISRACTVLTDLRERLAYDNRIGTDYGQDQRVALSFLFDAEGAFQDGVTEMDGANWPDALILFTKAAEANPRDPEYLAHKGWATYQALKSGQSSDSFAPNKARNILERALAVDSRHGRAILFLARLEKDLGNLEASRAWYQRLQKLDPTNDEALASLDWLNASSPTSHGTPEQGFWSWLTGIFTRK